jgi:hypothetical protein
MTNLKPFILKTSSVSFGSSRARARDGPPQPPEFRKMRMGLTSLFLKYSAISSVADLVTSSMATSPQKYLFYDFKNLGNNRYRYWNCQWMWLKWNGEWGTPSAISCSFPHRTALDISSITFRYCTFKCAFPVFLRKNKCLACFLAK